MASAAMRWDPTVEVLLRGALLSRTSSLRVLGRDTDALRVVVAAFRAACARHIDWSTRGVQPTLGVVDFPPPVVLKRSLHDHSKLPHDTINLLSGYDYGKRSTSFMRGAVSRDIIEARALWRGLFKWAAEKGLFKGPLETTSDSLNVHRQELLLSLEPLIEPFYVNMLPIVMGVHSSLPDKCKRYSNLINLCLARCPDEVGKIGYLTILEGFVEPGGSATQSCPSNLHIESPASYLVDEPKADESASRNKNRARRGVRD
ncbi:hypothetical protein HK405_000580, partial [Cladochytrium tenue]